jgi:hypothetical protein
MVTNQNIQSLTHVTQLILLVRMLSEGLCLQDLVYPALTGNEDRRTEIAGPHDGWNIRRIEERHSHKIKVGKQSVIFKFYFSISANCT